MAGPFSWAEDWITTRGCREVGLPLAVQIMTSGHVWKLL